MSGVDMIHTIEGIETVGQLRAALAGYDASAQLEVWLNGEYRLDEFSVYRQGGPETNPDGPPDLYWPMIVVER